MNKLNVANTVGMLALTAVLAVVATLAYLTDRPEITATADYSAWTLPTEISKESYKIRLSDESINLSSTTRFFFDTNSYLILDIRNTGEAAAKEIGLISPIEGIYEIEGSEIAHTFEDKISIGDLNPGEGVIIRIWSKSSRSIQHGDIMITHTRGIETVDLGYETTGLWAKILRNIHLVIIFGPSVVILIYLAVMLSVHIRKKSSNIVE